MLSSAKKIYKQLKPYLKKGYILCPDTNFLMSASGVFNKLKGEKILVSKQVYNELDKLKKVPENASKEEKRRSFEAREGLRAMDQSQSSIIELAPSSVFEKYKLSNSPDERIIANYLHHRDETGAKVLFLTLDRGAKMIAKSKGLETVEFDLDTFNKKRKKEQKVLSKFAGKSNLNPLQRFVLGLGTVYAGITLLVQFALGLLLVLFLIGLFANPSKGYVADVKPVSLMDNGVTITPTLIYQEKDEKKFYIHYEIMNNQKTAIYGFYNPDRPLTFQEKEKAGEGRLKYMKRQQHYQNQLFLDQIYVMFKGRENENVFAVGSTKEVPAKERIKGVIEVEGDLKKLIELKTSVFLKDQEERIPYTIKIGNLKEMKSSEIRKLKEEL